MRIFIAYTFRERDQWIEDLVFPLLRGFKSKPVDTKLNWDGQRLYFYGNAAQLAIASSRIVLHVTTSEAAFESDRQSVDHVTLPVRLDAYGDVLPDPRPRGPEATLGFR